MKNQKIVIKTIVYLVIFSALSAVPVSAQYILNQTAQQTADFNISGTGTANVFSAGSEYRLAGGRVLGGTGGNFFAGLYSGINTTTGVNNSFIGYAAGYLNTTAHYNSFVGAFAGYSNTTGYSNSFFGSATGYYNTTGHQNLFSGFQAGVNNTSGSDNSFVGSGAGYFNSIGSGNSFVGSGAGANVTNGLNNSFFGKSAGLGNITGANNTLLGANADLSATNLTFATAIGAGAVVGTSNTILLGRTDGSDKVRIYGLGAAGSTQLCRNAAFQIATCSSSLRYKTNITPFLSGLSLIARLRPIAFEWKDGGMKDVGFGAEEVAGLDPLFVTFNEKGEVEGVKYDRLSVAFVNAFKEQQTQIETQKQLLDRQQKRIDDLTALICASNRAAKICQE